MQEKIMNQEELHRCILEKQDNICQAAAMKNGKLIYSDTWNSFRSADSVHIASATKSIMSLLVGIAMNNGLIQNTGQKVLEFFPNYQIKRGEKTIQQVSLKHLLTMTAPYKYKSEPWTKICTSQDWTAAALDLLGGRSGITGAFKYSTLGIQILSAIITKVSGMTTLEFANRRLFEPLGIEARESFTVKSKEEHIRFVTSKAPKETVWFCDPKGTAAAGFGLCLSAEDMAKIGQLCLEEGVYQGRRIVSSRWIHEMTTPFVPCGERFHNMAYGYLWWIIDEAKHVYAAVGDSGNVIYVNPQKNLVISVTSTFKPAVFDRIQFVQEYIEPFVEKCKGWMM